MSSIEDELIFYPRFPNSSEEVRVALRGLWSGRLTEKAVCCYLRHYFTNYDDLSRSRKWEHEFLRNKVNEMILDKVGRNWKKNKKDEK